MSVGGSRVSGGDGGGEGKAAGPAQLAAENESAVCRRRGDAVSPSGLSGRGMGCLRRVQYALRMRMDDDLLCRAKPRSCRLREIACGLSLPPLPLSMQHEHLTMITRARLVRIT